MSGCHSMQKAVISGINRIAVILRMKKAPLARQERDLLRAEKLIELYEPFILHNEHVFECENARLLSAALPPEERGLFAFDPESIDWWITGSISISQRCAAGAIRSWKGGRWSLVRLGS